MRHPKPIAEEQLATLCTKDKRDLFDMRKVRHQTRKRVARRRAPRSAQKTSGR